MGECNQRKPVAWPNSLPERQERGARLACKVEDLAERLAEIEAWKAGVTGDGDDADKA